MKKGATIQSRWRQVHLEDYLYSRPTEVYQPRYEALLWLKKSAFVQGLTRPKIPLKNLQQARSVQTRQVIKKTSIDRGNSGCKGNNINSLEASGSPSIQSQRLTLFQTSTVPSIMAIWHQPQTCTLQLNFSPLSITKMDDATLLHFLSVSESSDESVSFHTAANTNQSNQHVQGEATDTTEKPWRKSPIGYQVRSSWRGCNSTTNTLQSATADNSQPQTTTISHLRNKEVHRRIKQSLMHL